MNRYFFHSALRDIDLRKESGCIAVMYLWTAGRQSTGGLRGKDGSKGHAGILAGAMPSGPLEMKVDNWGRQGVTYSLRRKYHSDADLPSQIPSETNGIAVLKSRG